VVSDVFLTVYVVVSAGSGLSEVTFPEVDIFVRRNVKSPLLDGFR